MWFELLDSSRYQVDVTILCHVLSDYLRQPRVKSDFPFHLVGLKENRNKLSFKKFDRDERFDNEKKPNLKGNH